jgi:hypothetical protein
MPTPQARGRRYDFSTTSALKMAPRQIVGARRRIAPGPRQRLGPTTATAAIFMVSGCPQTHGHERLLLDLGT